jgi:hypothetical protein
MLIQFKDDFSIFKKDQIVKVGNKTTAANLIKRGIAQHPKVKKATKKK